MTWFKVDDSFYDHLKVFDAPDCAVALWVRAGAWAARNLTDGFVPSGMPARLCDDPETAIKELVRRKLWLRVKDGFRFHDWTKYQPTRESVEHDREQATERKRRERERRRGEKAQVKPPPVTQESRRDTPVTEGVTHGPVTSPRPDPTRPGLPNGSPNTLAGSTDRTIGQLALIEHEGEPQRQIKANDVVAAFHDGAKAAGRTITKDSTKKVSGTAKRLLEQNPQIADEKFLDAAYRMGAKGWDNLNAQLLRGDNDQGRAGGELARRGDGLPGPRSPADQRIADAQPLYEKYKRQEQETAHG